MSCGAWDDVVVVSRVVRVGRGRFAALRTLVPNLCNGFAPTAGCRRPSLPLDFSRVPAFRLKSYRMAFKCCRGGAPSDTQWRSLPAARCVVGLVCFDRCCEARVCRHIFLTLSMRRCLSSHVKLPYVRRLRCFALDCPHACVPSSWNRLALSAKGAGCMLCRCPDIGVLWASRPCLFGIAIVVMALA